MPLYKAQFDHGGRGITNPTGNALTIYDQSGKVIHTNNTPVRGTEGSKFVIPNNVNLQAGYTYSIDGGPKYTFGDPTQRQEFDPTKGGAPLKVGGRGSAGSSVSGGGGGPNGNTNFTPGNIGFGAIPANLLNEFPNAYQANYNPIKTPDYKFTDPASYANGIADNNRDQIKKNSALAKDTALGELDTELQGLQTFVPQATALKRDTLSADNLFNQQQRTNQINSTLPELSGQLQGQASRAEAYANGQLPSAIDNRGFELNSRSAAADRSASGGFGASSSVARKASDLYSADRRVQLSQYGDQLLSGNINQKAGLFLSPTEYSNAGQQISVNPSISAGQLQSHNLSENNQLTTLSPSTALSAQLNQNQFTTGLEQQTRQFNASNSLQTAEFNVGNLNSFALQKFGYAVGYANSAASAAQTDTNTRLGIAQQGAAAQIAQQYHDSTQGANTLGSITQGVGTVAQLIPSLTGGDTGTTSLGSAGGGGNTNTPGGYDLGNLGSYGSGGTALGGGQQFSPLSGVGPSSTLTTAGPSGAAGSYAAPSPQLAPAVSSFARDIQPEALSAALSSSNQGVTQRLLSAAAPVLNSAGVYSSPQPGTQLVGNNNFGQPVFMNASLLKSTDSTMGSQTAAGAASVANDLGAFAGDPEAAQTMNAVIKGGGDPSVINTLDTHAANKDWKGFVGTLTNDNSDVTSKFAAYQVGQNWDQMSPAQKSMSVVASALQNFKFSDGTNLATRPLVKNADGKTEVSMGDAVGLIQNGYNAFPVVKNWNQLKTISDVSTGQTDPKAVAQIGQSLGLLGSGKDGVEVPSITTDKLKQAGWTPAPHLGVGAIIGSSSSFAPNGYTPLTLKDGTKIAVPSKSISTTQGALQDSLIGTAAGNGGGLSTGALKIHQQWGQASEIGKGSNGGSAMVGGLDAVAKGNPYLLSGIVSKNILQNASITGNPNIVAGAAVNNIANDKQTQKSIVSGAATGSPTVALGGIASRNINGGKSSDQQARDSVRSNLQTIGLSDKDHNVTLADGSKVNIGVDGKGGTHSVTNPSLLSPEQQGKVGELHSYDIDYTNNLDYMSGMGGTTLSRLTSGKTGKEVDQLGGQLGNAALGSVGYGKEMTPENFSKVQANQKSMYAQAGIKSKADMYQLINQGFSEGRFNETDVITMQQTANMIFDQNGYDTAQKLMSGRNAPKTDTNTTAPTGSPKLDRNGIEVGYRPILPQLPDYLEKWVDRGAGYRGDKEMRDEAKKAKRRSTGSLIGGTIGTIAGAAIGGPAGASVGGSAGAAIGGEVGASTTHTSKDTTYYPTEKDQIAARNQQRYGQAQVDSATQI